MILHGDCLESMTKMGDATIDAIVTDPPYHLTSIVERFGKKGAAPASQDNYARLAKGFMGLEWDGGDIAFQPEIWQHCLRVLKPGAHLVAFGGTRTYHRMASAIEDAGFNIRDMLVWLYGQGFPKNHKVSEDGEWGTALRPSQEPIVLARAPLAEKSIAANHAAHSTGGINVQGTRIPVEGDDSIPEFHYYRRPILQQTGAASKSTGEFRTDGRWPPNVLHDGSAAIVTEFPDRKSGGSVTPANQRRSDDSPALGRLGALHQFDSYNDTGSAARFFYCAKPSRAEREEGLEWLEASDNGRRNIHPTVKPIDLMRWLVRLVCPKGGTVLDPFCGSGTTLIAAHLEGMTPIGIEQQAEYVKIAQERFGHFTAQGALDL